MVRKIYEIGEKENPRKKYRGIFENIFPVLPYGSLRHIHLRTDDDKDYYLKADFKTLEREGKGINLGDRIEIDYRDYNDFTIKKIMNLKEEICKYLADKGLELVSQPSSKKQIFIGKSGLTVVVEKK